MHFLVALIALLLLGFVFSIIPGYVVWNVLNTCPGSIFLPFVVYFMVWILIRLLGTIFDSVARYIDPKAEFIGDTRFLQNWEPMALAIPVFIIFTMNRCNIWDLFGVSEITSVFYSIAIIAIVVVSFLFVLKLKHYRGMTKAAKNF